MKLEAKPARKVVHEAEVSATEESDSITIKADKADISTGTHYRQHVFGISVDLLREAIEAYDKVKQQEVAE